MWDNLGVLVWDFALEFFWGIEILGTGVYPTLYLYPEFPLKPIYSNSDLSPG